MVQIVAIVMNIMRGKMNQLGKIELEIGSLKSRLRNSLESKGKIDPEILAHADAIDRLLSDYDYFLINEVDIQKEK
jgi:hypothetical protein